jgi:excinuclease UvrABC ATPase subunit
VFKTIQILLVGLISVLFLTACGPSQQDAEKLGFANVAEMKEIQAKGFQTKEAYAKSLGFDSAQEMKDAQLAGFSRKKDFDISEAKRLGFDSVAEKKDINEKGFKTKQEYLEAVEKAKQAGWSIYAEKLYAHSRGIDDPKEFHKLMEKEKNELEIASQKEKIALQKEKDREYREGQQAVFEMQCNSYKKARSECAVAANYSQCMDIKDPMWYASRSFCH